MSKRLNELKSTVLSVTAEIRSLNAAIDAYRKTTNATAADVQQKFGSSLASLEKQYASIIKEVTRYNSANNGNVKSNETLKKSIEDLINKENTLRSSHNSLISTATKLSKSERELTEALKKKTREVERSAKALEKSNAKKEDAERKLAEAEKRIEAQKLANREKAERERLKIEEREALKRQKLREKEEKQKDAIEARERKRNSFLGGFASTVTPEAIGKATASLVKFIAIYSGIRAIGNGVREAVVGSIDSFIRFEDQLGKLSAVSGASSAQIKVIGDTIRETAVQTRFTSSEVATLGIELSKLGATSNQIPDLILPVAQAAQAIGADLATVGEVIFKVNNQFSLSSAETASTAQTLVSAINESALSLESFGTAIQYVGPIANQIGLTFSETASFLEVLSNNGFTASRIGTGLRKIFIDLKKPGEDISETLQKLADRNIGLAEANELVGKTAAAQLITLLSNLDAIKQNSTESERLTDSLRASAAQMSTTAGAVDILKSSYEDLKISIGDAIVNSELFTEAIGLVFPQAERLIRGYNSLNSVLSDPKGIKIAQEELKNLSTTSADSFEVFLASLNILRRTGADDELISLFDKLKAAGLSYGQAQTLIFKKTQQGEGAFKRYLAQILPLGPETRKIIDVFNDTGISVEELGDKFSSFRGFQKIIADQAKEVIKANKVEKERNETYAEYSKSIEKIKNLGPTSDAAGLAAQKLELDVRKELVKTQSQLNDERNKGFLADEDQILNLTGRASGLEKVIQALSEFGVQDEEQLKKEKKTREARAKLDTDDIKRRRDNIKEELKRIKEQREEEIRIAEEKRKLLLKNETLTADQRLEVEEDFNDAVKISNEKAIELVDDQLKLLEPLYVDAGKVVKRFGKEFPDLVDELDKSVGDLSDIFGELSKSIDSTFLDAANDAIEDSKSVIAGYETQVNQLNEKFGDNAGKTRAYFKELESITNNLSAQLQGIADGLDTSTEEGRIAFEVIQRLLDKVEATGKKAPFNWDKFWEDLLVNSLNETIDRAFKALDQFNDVYLENTRNRLQAELDAVKNSADIENDILRSKLDSQLITEAEYRAQLEKNRKKEITQQNAIEKQIFEAEQKRDRQSALSDYLQSVASVIPNLIVNDGEANPIALAIKAAITTAFATASYGAEIRAINQRKFFPTKFAEGGLVTGPSHEQGGVPFSVQGRGGYEMEGGEYIVNKRATQKYKSVLDQINSYGKSTYKFANGGLVKDPIQVANRQLELLEAIASSNVSMVGKLDKPVRAFVASDDLRSDSNALRIKERNSQL